MAGKGRRCGGVAHGGNLADVAFFCNGTGGKLENIKSLPHNKRARID